MITLPAKPTRRAAAAVAAVAAIAAFAVPAAGAQASTPTTSSTTAVSASTIHPDWWGCGYYDGSSAVIQWGDSGNVVREAQCLLDAWGFNAGAVEGDFGPNTYNATRAFQSFCRYKVDGIVGPQTWGGLRNGCPRI
jgi:peptidoglycan hydrolase-like protein with peptidoglycan-binding domain